MKASALYNLEFFLTLASLGLFHLLAVISPGPSLIAVIQTSISSSRKEGILNALGFGVGSVVWAVAAIFGLNVLFAAVPWVYLAVKMSGALYLIYLGYKLLKSQGLKTTTNTDSHELQTAIGSFMKGLMIQLSNPKVVIFMGSILTVLLPQNPAPELLFWVVAVIFLNEFLWYSLIASVFSIERLRNGYVRASKLFDRAAGVLLGGLGLKILTQ